MSCQCNGAVEILWAKRDGKNRPARYCKQCGAFGEWLGVDEARAFYRMFFTKDKPAKKVHQVHPPKQMTLGF